MGIVQVPFDFYNCKIDIGVKYLKTFQAIHYLDGAQQFATWWLPCFNTEQCNTRNSLRCTYFYGELFIKCNFSVWNCCIS